MLPFLQESVLLSRIDLDRHLESFLAATQSLLIKAVQNLRKKLRFYQLDEVKLIPHFSHSLGKPTALPTLRWVFQCFMSVHLVSFGGIKQISNLTSERSHIL